MKKTKATQRPRFTNARKAIRKQKRQEKKAHRQEHYMKKKTTQNEPKFAPGRFVRRPADDIDTETVNKKKKKQQNQPSSHDILTKERQKEQKEVQRLNSQMDKQRRKMLLEANEDEEKMIKKLEKQLGLNKAKNKNRLFADDGLDYLLEICDRTTSEQIVAAEKHLAEVENESDFEEDLATVTGKEIKKNHKKKDTDSKKKDDRKAKDDNEKDEDDELSDEFNNENEELSGDELEIDGEESEVSDMGSELDEDGASGSECEDNDSGPNIGDSDSSDGPPEEKPTKSKKAVITTKSNDIQKKPEKKFETKPSKERTIKAEDLSKVFSDDEVSHLSGDDEDMEVYSDDDMGEDDEKSVDKKDKEKPDVWEDIYGRKRDKEGNVIKEEKGVYIPPHLRNKDSNSDKEMVQLKRQIKSVLNKLAGTNLHWASSCIESLYSSNSRHSVNSALSQLWTEATVAPCATPDRMVAEHAALVAILHANVGEEIGAHFLQELTKKFDYMMQTPQPVADKHLDNLVCCLAHLYNFKIYQSSLLYDILSRLTETLSEKSVECVVVALRCAGENVRREDPLALRDFIHRTQQRAAAASDCAAIGSRIKFLLEVLMAVKNNNLSKIPNYEPTYCDHLRKTIRGIIRKGNYVVPLNIRLEDLLKVEERGKWWVVGSAWAGSRAPPTAPPNTPPSAPPADARLLELARQQRMNTDVRRTIFCVIMAAEDYMAAFEKLQQLGLRGAQQREIAHVVLACSLQERTYNPYYGVLATKLADSDRKYQLSFQFSIWDKIKDLENLGKHQVTNLAQLLAHLIMQKGLPLSALKIIQFSDLTKRTVKFMRQILLLIIMNEDLQTSLEVFHRISKSPKLHMFRESLRLFIQHFVVKNAEKKNNVLSDKEMTVLKDRAAVIEKILTMHDSKMLF